MAGSALFFLRCGGRFGRWLRVGQLLVLPLTGGVAMAVAMVHERSAWQRGVFVDRRWEAIFQPDALLIGVAIESFWKKFGRWPASFDELAAATPDFTPSADWFYEPPWNDDPTTPLFAARSRLQDGWWVIRRSKFELSRPLVPATCEYVDGPFPLRSAVATRRSAAEAGSR